MRQVPVLVWWLLNARWLKVKKTTVTMITGVCDSQKTCDKFTWSWQIIERVDQSVWLIYFFCIPTESWKVAASSEDVAWNCSTFVEKKLSQQCNKKNLFLNFLYLNALFFLYYAECYCFSICDRKVPKRSNIYFKPL